MIEMTSLSFGPSSAADRLSETGDPSAKGAEAALETFYHGLNNRDLDALRANWSTDPLAQLDNPVGGILRGGDAIAGLYARIADGSVTVEVTFGDVVAYLGEHHAVFAGRESGSYTTADGTRTPLEIRTSRYFRYEDGHWRQYHHHGSIDDPDALRAYQRAVLGS
ncbi:YybH family protein [Streptomyces sp. NPDC020983]|uniref:YybH family protein n=1 Tax=Streptomyces sp. NPDC020983 TaxID=3365106 RepID=UPI0037B06B44